MHIFFKERILSINENVHLMRKHQIVQRIQYASDSFHAELNNEYVMRHAIYESIGIILCALITSDFFY